MIHPKLSWNEYFSGSPETTLSGQYNSRENPSVSSVYVSNCLFNGCTSGNNGGALYCTSATSFLIESSSFFSCKTSSSQGGAIYFANSGAQSVLYGLCGYDCCSTYTSSTTSYQFAFIQVKNDISSKNYVNYSSIVRCVNERSSSHYTIRLCYGKNCCPSVNSSMNKFKYFSGINCYPSINSNYVACSLSYSSFSNNDAFGYICFYFDINAQYEMKCCNILRNTQTSSSYGIVSTWGNLIIEDSCILENQATYIFYASSYTITLSNCTVDKTTITSGSLTILKPASNSFIHGLHHISTQNCHSEYDSAGYLTAIPQLPSSSKKQIQCYTIGNFFHQCRLSDVVLLTNFLIFNFVHPYASGNLWY
jgi:hypothetical protein